MDIVSLTKDKYQKWDKFCLESDAWFWHTTSWLEYSLAYRPEYGSKSLSFMIMENNQILAICPLILETRNGIPEFAFGGEGTWSPAPAFSDKLSDRKREQVAGMIFAHIDELVLENEVSYSYFVIPPLTFPRNNWLMKQGYLNISLNTQIIDLTQDLRTIRKGMRKGHIYNIDSGLRQMEIKNAHSWEAFSKYVDLLHKGSSHTYETRPQVTFNMQYDWLQQGNAILLGAILDGEYVGFSHIITYKKKAYYGSACGDSKHSELPIAHVLTWGTIQWLKEHEFEYYEIGWQQYGPQAYDSPSDKEIAISFFKRGFGGFAAPLFRGEKYYVKKEEQ